MEYLIDMWTRHLTPLVGSAWDSVVFWRSVALVSLSAIVCATCTRDRWLKWLLRPDHLEHDRKMFERADSVLPEPRLLDTLYWLTSEAAISNSNLRMLRDLRRTLEESGNQFVTRRVSRSAMELHARLEALLGFTAQHFFTWDRRCWEETWYALYPDHRSTHDEEKRKLYDKYARELTEVASDIQSAYRRYRLTVKEVLAV